MRHEIAHRQNRGQIEAVVLTNHASQVFAAAIDIGHQFFVGQGIGIDRQKFLVSLDRSRFCFSIPAREVFSPDLFCKDLLGGLETCGNFFLGRWHNDGVGEPIHEPVFQSVD